MGLRIKELREDRHLSQERLAQQAGVSLKTVSRVERTGNATAKTLTALASALDLSIGDLFENGDAA